jgi:4-hydroxy-3-polyprenylbenzoate decarboxylase
MAGTSPDKPGNDRQKAFPMLDKPASSLRTDAKPGGPPLDFQDHLARLKAAGLLTRIDRAIDKDTELHPLTRWQFSGGLAEGERRAFLFTNVVDGSGRRYDIPVVVGALAASPQIYSVGMGRPVEEIGTAWIAAINAPIAPVRVQQASCQEVVITGETLRQPGEGLARLPVPVSTPGFDAAPYFTATLVVTKDPETGIQNMGTYRAALKATDRLGVRMSSRVGGAGGYQHWRKYNARKEPMPVAIVIGAAPVVAFTGPQKLALDFDEMGVAGALAGAPVETVKGVTVDLWLPAHAEIVIEGLIDPELLEPEGPFGESHGHVALEDFNMSMQVTAITHKRDPVFVSIISQVTPSESSVIKKVAFEPMFFSHLRNHLGIKGISRVVMHEPLSNLRKVIFLEFAHGSARTEVWRGLHAASTFMADCGKIVVAVTDDIDASNADAVFWSMAYRCNPTEDAHIAPYRSGGHGPKSGRRAEDSTLLIDATAKHRMPPFALPKREFMERARTIWEELGLPALSPQPPWHGVPLGDWSETWDLFAKRAAEGAWEENGIETFARRRGGLIPETPVREVEGEDVKRGRSGTLRSRPGEGGDP